METPAPTSVLAAFLTRWRAALVILSGDARGMEYQLDQGRTALGRGPGVDLALDDHSLRRQHALVEFDAGHFVLREAVADGPAPLQLKDGDHFRLGAHEFAFVLEAKR